MDTRTLTAVDSGTANFLGYTNQNRTYADILKSRGGQSTTSLGHSRGTLVQVNAFNILNGQGYTNDQLTARGVGGATTAQTYTDAATGIGAKGKNVSFLWSVATTSNSVHSCYGTGAAGCTQVEIPVSGGTSSTQLIQYRNGQLVTPDGQ